jgi:8-oxo-dGTP diphosphatase
METGTGFWFRFCPRCGNALARGERCSKCGYLQYRNPVAVTAGILLSTTAGLPPAGQEVPPEAATHILMVRRAATYAGSWCIPCGYVDYDEEIREATRREMLEETGLAVEVGRVWAVKSNSHKPGNHTIGVWFLTRYVEGELRAGDDADAAEFVPLANMSRPLAFPTDLEVIADLAAAREKSGELG